MKFSCDTWLAFWEHLISKSDLFLRFIIAAAPTTNLTESTCNLSGVVSALKSVTYRSTPRRVDFQVNMWELALPTNQSRWIYFILDLMVWLSGPHWWSHRFCKIRGCTLFVFLIKDWRHWGMI